VTAEREAGSLPALDPVIHAQARLRVMTVLSRLRPGDQIAFPRLQELLEMTAGNLSTHVRRLEEADYVAVTKAYEGRTPVTWVALTARGRRAYEEYVETLRAYLDAAPAADPTAADPILDEPPSTDQGGSDDDG